MIDPSARIHPTADPESDVVVGARTGTPRRAQVRIEVRPGTRSGADG